jgi:LysR family glycine cleavage system transcriptional activator
MDTYPRQIPPLNALRAFEAVARHLSFTGAADELGVTQGAVSQQVKKLEAHFGLLMFRRVHQGLLLTDAGQSYLPAVRDAFDGLALGTRNLQSRERGGVLTVSVSAGFATKWLVPRSHRFYERHPEIDLRISASPDHINFARGDVDLAVRHGDGVWPELDTTRLMAEKVFPVCSPRLAGKLHDLKAPIDLRHQTLLHSWQPDYWPRWFAAADAADAVDTTRGPVFSDHNNAIQAAIDGQGVALGRTALVGDDLLAGRLIRPFDQVISAEIAYWIVCPKGTAERPKIAAFCEWLLAEADALQQRLLADSDLQHTVHVP